MWLCGKVEEWRCGFNPPVDNCRQFSGRAGRWGSNVLVIIAGTNVFRLSCDGFWGSGSRASFMFGVEGVSTQVCGR